MEFIPAIDIVDSKKKENAMSIYEHFIHACVEHGLGESAVRSFLENQILADFVMTNTDRHLNNFGVLRNARTLEFVSMAPIFDSGNSMFWQNPRLPDYDDLTKIEVNSFWKNEKQLLSYIQNRAQLDISKLPTEDDLRSIYAMDSLVPCVDSILLGYSKKMRWLKAKFY